MMRRSLETVWHGGLLWALLLLPWVSVAAEDGGLALPEPLPLDWCLQRAEQANPELAMSDAEAAAAHHRIGPAGALDDPRFRYEAMNIPTGDLDFDSTPMSGHQLNLSQALPFPGLLGSRRAAARAGAGAAAFELADRRIRVAAAVERGFTELGYAQRALEITEQNLELLRQLSQVAETRYRVGKGLQQDVFRAHVEVSVMLQEKLARTADIARAEANLAALLDLPAETRFPRTERLDEEAPLPALEEVLAHQEAAHPRLKALAARIEQAERSRRAARLEGFPNLEVGLGYRIRERVRGDPVSGDDFISAGVTVRLPVNRVRWREHVAERDALVRRAKAAYRSARRNLGNEARSAFAELQRADSEVALLETGLVPQARQSLESNRSGYQVNKVDFLSLMDSQIRWRSSELQLIRAVSDRRASFATLEAALGGELR